MGIINITLTAEEEKALTWRYGSAAAWAQSYLKHLAGQAINSFVEEFSDYQARKKTAEEKDTIVSNTTVDKKI